jgi:hypothetical protein
MTLRSVTGMGMNPKRYEVNGTFWDGVNQDSRFQPTIPPKEEVFDEYLSNKSMSPSRHMATLGKSSGLMEMHYETMRKKTMGRDAMGHVTRGPTMGRSFGACAGYSGHIPGKIANNIVGTTWQTGSQVAKDTRGSDFDPVNSGVVFTLTARGGMGTSGSQGSLARPMTPTSPLAHAGELMMEK